MLYCTLCELVQCIKTIHAHVYTFIYSSYIGNEIPNCVV